MLQGIAPEQGRSNVIVSHDARLKNIADRVLWLEEGAFKVKTTMASDPVCALTVERAGYTVSARAAATPS